MAVTMLYSWTFVSVTMSEMLLNIVTDTNSHVLIQTKNYIKHKMQSLNLCCSHN